MSDNAVATRPPRSAALTLGQAILVLQAIAALAATSLVNGLERAGDLGLPPGAIWGVGLGTSAALIAAAGGLGRPGGRVIGWILQAPMLAVTPLAPPVGVVGGMFVVLWIAALRLGDRIDREREEYRRATREAEGDDT